MTEIGRDDRAEPAGAPPAADGCAGGDDAGPAEPATALVRSGAVAADEDEAPEPPVDPTWIDDPTSDPALGDWLGTSSRRISGGLPGLFIRELVSRSNPVAIGALVLAVAGIAVLALEAYWITVLLGIFGLVGGYLGMRRIEEDAEVEGHRVAGAAVSVGFGAVLLGIVGAIAGGLGGTAGPPAPPASGGAGLHYRLAQRSCAAAEGVATYEGTITNVTSEQRGFAIVVTFVGPTGVVGQGSDLVSVPPQGARSFQATAPSPAVTALQCTVTEVREP